MSERKRAWRAVGAGACTFFVRCARAQLAPRPHTHTQLYGGCSLDHVDHSQIISASVQRSCAHPVSAFFGLCFLPAARSERQWPGFHCNAGLHLMASVTHHTRSVKKETVRHTLKRRQSGFSQKGNMRNIIMLQEGEGVMPQRNIFKQRGEEVRDSNVTRNIMFGRPLLSKGASTNYVTLKKRKLLILPPHTHTSRNAKCRGLEC